MIGGNRYGLSWMYVFNLRGLLERVTYLRIKVGGEFILYYFKTLDWHPFGLLRVCVSSIEGDECSVLWVV